MYFENRFSPDFAVSPDPTLINAPVLIRPENLEKVPAPGKPLTGADFERFVEGVSEAIAGALNLVKV